MSDPHYEYIQTRYESYKDQRRRLDENALAVAAKHDQWVLTISGGALALSITFIEKVATSPYSWSIPFIALAWISFALSLLSGLLAIRFSSQGLVKQINLLDIEYANFSRTTTSESPEGISLPNEERKFPKRIKRWSTCSLVSLVFGIIFLCIFSIINIDTKTVDEAKVNKEPKTEGTKMSEKEKIDKSYVPPANDIPPPAPPTTETYIPPSNEIPPPPPPKKRES